MLLEHLSICNYGVYAGKNDFELLTTPDRPIILVGGFNGAGKTTILESMMIALYGKAYFGVKKSKKEYLSFIYDKIHRSNKKRADSASVQIAFRFYHNGSEDRYVINRNWSVDGMTVTESFSVKKNDQILNDVDESQWQSFIEGLLPLGIAKLFFFDGEKIVRVTENKGQYNDEIKRSLETLIGADLVHRLHADLNLYMLRKSDNKNDSMTIQYEETTQEKEQLALDIDSLNIEYEKKLSEINDLKTRISTKESTISSIGGGYADIRGDLLTQKAVLEEKIRHQRKQIQEDLSGDAPFYLVLSLLNKIAKQVREDAKILYTTCTNMSVELFIPEMKKQMSDPKFWPKNTDGSAMSLRILNMMQDIGTLHKGEIVFDLSPGDADFLIHIIKKIREGHKSLSDAIKTYADTTLLIENVEADIARIPKDDELGPRITEINEMHKEIGVLTAEITHIEQKLSSKKSYKKILQNKLKNMFTLIHSEKTAATGVQLASKMQNVLDEYYSGLKEKKIQELESNLLYTAKLLLHKNSIRKIVIDRNTFEIKAYENDEDQIPGDFLSMGERQIVGTALLWAIARTCGRSLPFVIDTPLGRLDGQHLLNLTKKFYPYASHQTVLLSTDREIGPKEYENLSESISKSYRITCDQDRSVTTVTSGYFMEDKIAQTR